MVETSARLLRLLSLLQSRREWRAADLADALGVTPRTVRRDIDRLRALDYPVNSTPGVAGGYRLGAGAALPPLLLDDGEAVAVAIGLRAAAVGVVAGIEEASVRALTKLEQVLPSRLRRQVTTLHAATVALTDASPGVAPETLTAIAAACRDQRRLRFAYRDHDGATSTRHVEPHRLVHTPRRWYLVAWDTGREGWRTFRVDRIGGTPQPGARCAPRTPPEDAATFVSRAVTSAPYRYQARVLVHAPAPAVADLVSPTTARIEAVDSSTCVLHAGSHSLDALALHVGMLPAEVEILEPPELVEHVRGVAARLARAVPPAPDLAGGTPHP